MIYTVTTSPTLDLMMDLNEALISGGSYRATHEELRPGGKGINISIMLRHLEITSTALGFVAGFSGDELMRLTAASGIQTGFIRVRRGRTRINLRIKDHQKETRINGLGPAVTAQDLEYLLRKLKSLTDDDILVLGGIVPPTLPQDIFKTFFKALEGKKTKVIIDTSPEFLEAILEFKPFLVKPDKLELSSYLKLDFTEEKDIFKALHYLKDKGAQNILLSLGKRGTYFMTADSKLTYIACPKAENAPNLDKTGAGDSMIAGFLFDYLETANLNSAALMAVAAGSATATAIGIASKDEVLKLRGLMDNNLE